MVTFSEQSGLYQHRADINRSGIRAQMIMSLALYWRKLQRPAIRSLLDADLLAPYLRCRRALLGIAPCPRAGEGVARENSTPKLPKASVADIELVKLCANPPRIQAPGLRGVDTSHSTSVCTSAT